MRLDQRTPSSAQMTKAQQLTTSQRRMRPLGMRLGAAIGVLLYLAASSSALAAESLPNVDAARASGKKTTTGSPAASAAAPARTAAEVKVNADAASPEPTAAVAEESGEPPGLVRPEFGEREPPGLVRPKFGVPPRQVSPPSMLVTTPAPALRTAAEAPALEPAATLHDLGNLQNHWQLSLGLRSTLVSDADFDAFGTDNALNQVALSVGRSLYSRGPLSYAFLLGIEGGEASATIREQPSSLTLTRFMAAAEGRYHLFPRGFVFGRLAPQLALATAEIDDSGASAEFEDSQLRFGIDLSAGFAFNVAGKASGKGRSARLWFLAEGGYGLLSLSNFELATTNDEAASTGSLTLSGISLNAPFFRVSAALTF